MVRPIPGPRFGESMFMPWSSHQQLFLPGCLKHQAQRGGGGGTSVPCADPMPASMVQWGGRGQNAHHIHWPGSQHVQLIRQEMAVCPEQLSTFLESLRQYLRATAGASACVQ